MAVSFPSLFAVAGGDLWVWGSLPCCPGVFPPFPAMCFQVSGAPATPEKLVNVLVAPCLVCYKSLVLRCSGAGSHGVVSLA